MTLNFLPKKILSALEKLDTDKLYHIRMRKGYSVSVIYDSSKAFLSDQGLTIFENKGIICDESDIKEIIETVTEHSVYAFNESIKQGFITTRDGIRIGLAGDCVFDNGNIITIKNFNSLSIRIPHKISGVSKKIFSYIANGRDIYNTLIISPPGFGKTTLLKDIAETLNNSYRLSILIIDERNEFINVSGVNIDKIVFSDKLYALNYGIRSVAPEIVITDELGNISDWLAVRTAVNSGVKIIASCHGSDFNDLKKKENFTEGIFDRYIFLKGAGMPGQISSVYDGECKKL